MVDLHCHILPGIDDGAIDISSSIDMAKQAEKEGITTIVATPHHKNGSYNNSANSILAQMDSLNETIKQAGVHVTILPGQEIRIYGELLEDYKKGELLTVGNQSSYILIELPSGHVPTYTEKLLFDVQMSGLVPVIVHPERNRELIEHPDKLYKLVKSGAVTQITAGSLAGKFGKNIQKFSRQMIESNLTHVIASDAHNINSRGFHMNAAYSLIEKVYGIEAVYYFKENAELLISGKHVYKEVPEQIVKKKKVPGNILSFSDENEYTQI